MRKSTGCTEEVQARMIEQTMVAVNKGLTTRQRAQNIWILFYLKKSTVTDALAYLNAERYKCVV